MKEQTTRNFHVPLSDHIYRRLRIEAQRSNRRATDIAREAIDRLLEERQREFIHESVAAYALEAAGSSSDLDEQLEAAGIESLLELDSGVTEDCL